MGKRLDELRGFLVQPARGSSICWLRRTAEARGKEGGAEHRGGRRGIERGGRGCGLSINYKAMDEPIREWVVENQSRELRGNRVSNSARLFAIVAILAGQEGS